MSGNQLIPQNLDGRQWRGMTPFDKMYSPAEPESERVCLNWLSVERTGKMLK